VIKDVISVVCVSLELKPIVTFVLVPFKGSADVDAATKGEELVKQVEGRTVGYRSTIMFQHSFIRQIILPNRIVTTIPKRRR
jgi:hypothetical protein